MVASQLKSKNLMGRRLAATHARRGGGLKRSFTVKRRRSSLEAPITHSAGGDLKCICVSAIEYDGSANLGQSLKLCPEAVRVVNFLPTLLC